MWPNSPPPRVWAGFSDLLLTNRKMELMAGDFWDEITKGTIASSSLALSGASQVPYHQHMQANYGDTRVVRNGGLLPRASQDLRPSSHSHVSEPPQKQISPPAPGKPSDDCSPWREPEGHHLRDPKPELPGSAAADSLTHISCEIINVVLGCWGLGNFFF